VRVSIALCTYNGARFIGEQLDSIAAQSRPPDELVVCDDRSDDDTVERVRKWAENAAFPVRIEVNEERLGSTRNFAKAIGLCSGDLIALCDQDDVWLPRKLELSARAFEDEAEVGAVFSDAELVDEDLRPLGRRLWETVNFDSRHQQLLMRGGIEESMLLNSFVTGATLTFRSELRGLVLPFPDDLPTFIHDRWIALCVLAVSQLRFVAEPLMLYRQHHSQQLGVKLATPPWRERVRHRLRWDRTVFAYELKAMQRLQDRLAGCPRAVHPSFSDALAGRIDLLRARTSLPRRRFARVPVVATELLAGRYHRFANGSLSALKDLFA
jgi:glycosyltransferase involved in cell wall biosynthesis